MTATVEMPGAGRDDPLFDEGLAHLQGGKWAEALKCFETLARRYPEDPAVGNALEQARFKARLDATAGVRARRWTFPWQRWAGGRAAGGGGDRGGGRRLHLHAAAGQAGAGRGAATRAGWQGCSAPATRCCRPRATTRPRGSTSEALALAPDSEEAQSGLKQVSEGRAIFGAYSEGVALQQGGDLAGALEKLGPIVVQRPAYRDVSVRIGEIKREMQLTELFQAAEADLAAGKYADALAKYEQVQGAERELPARRDRRAAVHAVHGDGTGHRAATAAGARAAAAGA